jgi:hypothetical protein
MQPRWPRVWPSQVKRWDVKWEVPAGDGLRVMPLATAVNQLRNLSGLHTQA